MSFPERRSARTQGADETATGVRILVLFMAGGRKLAAAWSTQGNRTAEALHEASRQVPPKRVCVYLVGVFTVYTSKEATCGYDARAASVVV